MCIGLASGYIKPPEEKKMNCKDNCFNYIYCRLYGGWNGHIRFFSENAPAELCPDFIDKSFVFIMPCKILSEYYIVPTINNKLKDITKMKCIGFNLSHTSYVVNLINDKNKLYQPNFDEFKQIAFSTYEDAEKALRNVWF